MPGFQPAFDDVTLEGDERTKALRLARGLEKAQREAVAAKERAETAEATLLAFLAELRGGGDVRFVIRPTRKTDQLYALSRKVKHDESVKVGAYTVDVDENGAEA